MAILKIKQPNGSWATVSGTSEAVKFTEQQLTEEQKKIARENIGAISVEISETPKDGEILVYDATTNKLVNSGYTFESLKTWIQQQINNTILNGEW
jgi:ribonuclease HIII